MKLATRLFGLTYTFKSVKEVLAKANEPRSGDVLAGVAAQSSQERIAAKHVGQQNLGLVDTAQDAGLAREHFHHDDRIEALPSQDLIGAREVDVRRIAREDACRGRPPLPDRTVHGTTRLLPILAPPGCRAGPSVPAAGAVPTPVSLVPPRVPPNQ